MRARHVALFVALVAGAFPASAAAAERHPCEPRGSRTVEANQVARVFVQRRRTQEIARVYACAYRTRRVIQLGLYKGGSNCISSSGCSAVDDIRLVRAYVAYSEFHSGREITTSEVWRLDLRTGRHRLIWEAGSFRPPFEVSAFVTDLELRRTGGVAWVAVLHREGTPSNYEVWKADVAGRALLDSGPEIDPDSLALSGSILYWMNAGAPRTATLG
jgi:hypothetical protein